MVAKDYFVSPTLAHAVAWFSQVGDRSTEGRAVWRICGKMVRVGWSGNYGLYMSGSLLQIVKGQLNSVVEEGFLIVAKAVLNYVLVLRLEWRCNRSVRKDLRIGLHFE